MFHTFRDKTQTTQTCIGLPIYTYSNRHNERIKVPLIYKNERELAFHRVFKHKVMLWITPTPTLIIGWYQIVEASKIMVS
jgi:hypothetical protein